MASALPLSIDGSEVGFQRFDVFVVGVEERVELGGVLLNVFGGRRTVL